MDQDKGTRVGEHAQKAMLLSYESNSLQTHNAIRPNDGAAAHLDHAKQELKRHSAGPP
jgi:hypothetical protein